MAGTLGMVRVGILLLLPYPYPYPPFPFLHSSFPLAVLVRREAGRVVRVEAERVVKAESAEVSPQWYPARWPSFSLMVHMSNREGEEGPLMTLGYWTMLSHLRVELMPCYSMLHLPTNHCTKIAANA